MEIGGPVVNCTPHDVSLCDADGKVIKVFPKSGNVARVIFEEPILSTVVYDGITIPIAMGGDRDALSLDFVPPKGAVIVSESHHQRVG